MSKRKSKKKRVTKVFTVRANMGRISIQVGKKLLFFQLRELASSWFDMTAHEANLKKKNGEILRLRMRKREWIQFRSDARLMASAERSARRMRKRCA